MDSADDTASDDAKEEVVDAIIDVLDEPPLILDFTRIFYEERGIEYILSEMELTENQLSNIERHLLSISPTLGLPDGYTYIIISRLYLSIMRKSEEVSEELENNVEELKKENGYKRMASEEQESFGEMISDVKRRVGTRFIAEEISDDLLLLLTLVVELLREQTRNLFKYKFIKPEYRSSSKTSGLIDGLSQEEVDGLLLRSGVISEDTHSELQHVRDTRNNIIHNIRERITLEETATVSSEAERAVTVLNDIIELNEGIRPINTR